MSIKQSVAEVISINTGKGLAKEKAKTKKPSKVIRHVVFNDKLKANIHKNVVLVATLETKANETLKKVAAYFDTLLVAVPYVEFIQVQKNFKDDYMKVRNVDEGAANSAWRRLAAFMIVKKPKSPLASSQSMAKGAKATKPKNSVDNRIKAMSVRAMELLASIVKRDIYSSETIRLYKKVITALERDENEAYSLAKSQS
jgi:hypothetical protein